MDDVKDPANRIIRGTFTTAIQLSQQRTLSITEHIFSDESPEDVNVRVDRASDALDRQFIRTDLVSKEAQRAATLEGIQQFVKDLTTLSQRQTKLEAGGKISSAERQAIQNEKLQIKKGEANIEAMKRNIELLDAAIREGKRKLGTEVA